MPLPPPSRVLLTPLIRGRVVGAADVADDARRRRVAAPVRGREPRRPTVATAAANHAEQCHVVNGAAWHFQPSPPPHF